MGFSGQNAFQYSEQGGLSHPVLTHFGYTLQLLQQGRRVMRQPLVHRNCAGGPTAERSQEDTVV